MSNNFKRLWFVVIEQALKDAEGYGMGDKSYGENIREEARVWFLSENQGIGSFFWVCLVLDLNPEFLRKLHHPLKALFPGQRQLFRISM